MKVDIDEVLDIVLFDLFLCCMINVSGWVSSYVYVVLLIMLVLVGFSEVIYV